MTQQAYEQTVKQQEHIEDLLTFESFNKWFCNEYKGMTMSQIGLLSELKKDYLESFGLPTDSIIKGL